MRNVFTTPRVRWGTLAVATVLTAGCGTGSDSREPSRDVTAVQLVDAGGCDQNYSGCIPLVDYDLDCADVGRSVRVLGVDVHRFDADGDGYGCESYG
jgi:hypothetical protein